MTVFALALLTASLHPTQLRCNYRMNPVGIDDSRPRLSWILTAADAHARGLRQSAYQILAASSAADLQAGRADLWNSGKVDINQSIQIAYAGKPLVTGARVFWKVRVWDQAGRPSPWSEAASWSMGLLAPEDWKAKWIGRDETKPYHNPDSPYANFTGARWIWRPDEAPGPRFFRTTFTVPAGARLLRAYCIASTADRAEIFVNGQSAGAAVARMPELMDVASLLHPGQNHLAVRAGAVKQNKPTGVLAALRLEFAGHDPIVVRTGPDWKAAVGAPAGWEAPEFDDSAWASAQDLGPYGMAPWGDLGLDQERALPARMLRKEFDVTKPLKRAMVYVSGLGLSELYLNGAKVGDHVLSPALAEYGKRAFYVTYDVTRQMAAGRNAVGLILGSGRFYAPRDRVPTNTNTYGYPKAILRLSLEYTDGTTAAIVTDETWRLTTNGPIRANNEYDGEVYDARREMSGWSRAGFDDSKWQPAGTVAPPGGTLSAEPIDPLRVTLTLNPVKITRRRPGVYIFDMGQNMVGWCRLHISGPAGTRITLRHAETLAPDGSLYVANLRSARATDIYTLKGGGPETWEPRFTYHGFRYVEVSGFPGEPSLASLEGRVVHDDMPEIAEFSTSNPLLNRIHHNILWGLRGNYRSIPTDCPQRDERQGWLGDRSLDSLTETYFFDAQAFYNKWMQDIADSQQSTGGIPDVVPSYWPLYNDDVTWPATFILIHAVLYEQYGDLHVVERDYPSMRLWIEHMRGYLKDGLMPRDRYGDWCVPPESPTLIHSKDPARRTDGTLIATAYYYHLLRLVSGFARLLGKGDDAARYDELAAQVRAAFERTYYNPSLGYYGNGTQTATLLPLAVGITPKTERTRVFDHLLEKIQTESHGHIGVGLIGAQWLGRTLSGSGRPDVAYEIASQKTYPSWGYMVEKGATTIWELWNGDTADPAMNSGNHIMLVGDLGAWMYGDLGGIRPDPAHPGFQHAIIRPEPVSGLTYVQASHRSPYGTFKTGWKREANHLTLDVEVPPGAAATVYVPTSAPGSVEESGHAARTAAGVKYLRVQPGAAVFEVGSGHYSFRAQQ